MYYLLKRFVLWLVRLYSAVALSTMAMALLVCLWVSIVDRGYELLHYMKPGLVLGLFVFHIWMLHASNRSLSRRGYHDNRSKRSHKVQIRVY